MILDCKDTIDSEKLKQFTKKAIEKGYKVDAKRIMDNRTTRQNSALHLYFTFISDELNEMGIQYQYTGISGNTFELRYTTDLVKEFIWRPIQIALFKIESTTKINTEQINDIIDVITNFFADKGIVIEFPSIEHLIEK